MSREKRTHVAATVVSLALLLAMWSVPAWADLVKPPEMTTGKETPSAWAIQKIPRVSGPKMAQDEGGLLLGPVRIHGGVSVNETYTDNYFQEKNSPHSNWITTLTPFALLTLGRNRHNIEFEYRGDFERNKDYTKNNVNHHYLNGRFKLDFPGGLLLTGGHEYALRSNIATSVTDARKEYADNISSLNAVYSFADRYAIGTTYQHTFRRFDKSIYNADDLNRDDVSVAFYYRVLPKTRVFLEPGWAAVEYPERRNPSYDSKYYRFYVGVRTEATAKLAGQIKGGWLRKEYSDSRAGDDINGWGLEGNVEYMLTSKTPLNLSIFRRNDDTQLTTNQSTAFGASYDRTGFVLTARHNFTDRFHLRGNVGYELQEYHQSKGQTGPEREDKVFSASFGAEYMIWKAIFLGADYRFMDDNSNIDGTGYTENRFMVYLTLGY